MKSPPQKKNLQNNSSPPIKILNTPPPHHHHTHKIQHPPPLIQTQLLKYILILLQRKLNTAPILSGIYTPPPGKNININLII